MSKCKDKPQNAISTTNHSTSSATEKLKYMTTKISQLGTLNFITWILKPPLGSIFRID